MEKFQKKAIDLSLLSPLIVASHNEGKVKEIRHLLRGLVAETQSAVELDLPEPEETGDSFEANARLKAAAGMEATGRATLADDSGLDVAALNGAPGIYSARWGGPERDFDAAMQRVLREVAACDDQKDRRAKFVCALCLSLPSNGRQPAQHLCVRGEFHGHLAMEPRGAFGFGYDPIFIPDGYTQTCGEISPDLKARLSHRSQALIALRKLLETAKA